MLPSTLRSIRGALFPNNAPGKSTLSPPATDDDLRALRRRAATALWDLLPTPVATVYLGGVGSLPSLLRRDTTSSTTASTSKDSPGPMLDQLDGLLDVLDDEYCNKHLVYGILELLLVRIVPELSEHGVQDLLDQRLG